MRLTFAPLLLLAFGELKIGNLNDSNGYFLVLLFTNSQEKCVKCDEIGEAWSELAKEHDSKYVIVDEIDCESKRTDRKYLCKAMGVLKWPTVMYGMGHKLAQKWKGSFKKSDSIGGLKTEMGNLIKSKCFPSNLEACTKGDAEFMGSFLKLSEKDVNAKIDKIEQGVEDAEEAHYKAVTDLAQQGRDLRNKADADGVDDEWSGRQPRTLTKEQEVIKTKFRADLQVLKGTYKKLHEVKDKAILDARGNTYEMLLVARRTNFGLSDKDDAALRKKKKVFPGKKGKGKGKKGKKDEL